MVRFSWTGCDGDRLWVGGVNLSSDLDGVDQWASIKEEKEKSPHQFVIHNIDQDPQHNTWQVIEKWCLVCFLSLFFCCC